MKLPPRHRQPDIWRAAYAAAMVSTIDCVAGSIPGDVEHRFGVALRSAPILARDAFRIADAAVEAYEAELDRLASMAGGGRVVSQTKIQGDRTMTISERFGRNAVEVRHDIEGTSIRHVVVYRSGHEHEFSFLDLLARGDVPCSGEGEVCR